MKKGLICFFTAISICISSFVQKPPEPFVNGDRVGKKDAYLEIHEKSQRKKIQQQMSEMADEMFRIAKPIEHIIAIEKID